MLSQFGCRHRYLGTYELEEDAARAYDKLARILGRSNLNRSNLNFPDSDAVEICGPRSEGADKAVAAAVEDARTFSAAGGEVSHSSIYIGVCKAKGCKDNPWCSQINVGSRNVGCI